MAGLSRHSTHTRPLHALPGAAIFAVAGLLADGAAAVAVGVASGISVPVGYLSTEISNAAVAVAVADDGLVLHAMAAVALPATSAVPLLAADPSYTVAGWLPMVVVALDPLVQPAAPLPTKPALLAGLPPMLAAPLLVAALSATAVPLVAPRLVVVSSTMPAPSPVPVITQVPAVPKVVQHSARVG